jgi:GTP cyclohydrolase III
VKLTDLKLEDFKPWCEQSWGSSEEWIFQKLKANGTGTLSETDTHEIRLEDISTTYVLDLSAEIEK